MHLSVPSKFLYRRLVRENSFLSFDMSKIIRPLLSLKPEGKFKAKLQSKVLACLVLIASIHRDVERWESHDYECINEWSETYLNHRFSQILHAIHYIFISKLIMSRFIRLSSDGYFYLTDKGDK